MIDLNKITSSAHIFHIGATMQFLSQIVKYLEDNLSQDPNMRDALIDTAIEMLQNIKSSK